MEAKGVRPNAPTWWTSLAMSTGTFVILTLNPSLNCHSGPSQSEGEESRCGVDSSVTPFPQNDIIGAPRPPPGGIPLYTPRFVPSPLKGEGKGEGDY